MEERKLLSLNKEISEQVKISLHAVDFIETAIKAIESMEDFEEYKEQFLEAIDDIKTSLDYLNSISLDENPKTVTEIKTKSIETNTANINSNTIATSSVNNATSNLRFNYDDYLKKNNDKDNNNDLFFDYGSKKTFEEVESQIINTKSNPISSMNKTSISRPDNNNSNNNSMYRSNNTGKMINIQENLPVKDEYQSDYRLRSINNNNIRTISPDGTDKNDIFFPEKEKVSSYKDLNTLRKSQFGNPNEQQINSILTDRNKNETIPVGDKTINNQTIPFKNNSNYPMNYMKNNNDDEKEPTENLYQPKPQENQKILYPSYQIPSTYESEKKPDLSLNIYQNQMEQSKKSTIEQQPLHLQNTQTFTTVGPSETITNENLNNPNSTIQPIPSSFGPSLEAQTLAINDDTMKKKQKITRVADLVTKINSDQELYDLISKIFGEDVLDSLMSPNVDENLIESVEQSVIKIEELRQNDNENIPTEKPIMPEEKLKPYPDNKYIYNNNNNYEGQLNNQINIPNNEVPDKQLFYESANCHTLPKSNIRSYADELLLSKGYSVKGIPTEKSANRPAVNIRKYDQVNKYKEFNFENSLRSEPKLKSGKKSPSSSCYHTKSFVNYTSPHGHYFDTSLQNGGISKIPTYLDKNKNKRAFSPVREYIRGNNSFSRLGGYFKGY